MNMPAGQNRSNCAFRNGFLRLATMPTAQSGLKGLYECFVIASLLWTGTFSQPRVKIVPEVLLPIVDTQFPSNILTVGFDRAWGDV